jgi:hypothetical protein
LTKLEPAFHQGSPETVHFRAACVSSNASRCLSSVTSIAQTQRATVIKLTIDQTQPSSVCQSFDSCLAKLTVSGHAVFDPVRSADRVFGLFDMASGLQQIRQSRSDLEAIVRCVKSRPWPG